MDLAINNYEVYYRLSTNAAIVQNKDVTEKEFLEELTKVRTEYVHYGYGDGGDADWKQYMSVMSKTHTRTNTHRTKNRTRKIRSSTDVGWVNLFA